MDKSILLLTTEGGFISQFERQDVALLQEMGYSIYYAADFQKRMYESDDEFYENNGIHTIQVPMEKNPLAIWNHYRNHRILVEAVKRHGITAVHCHTPFGGMQGRLLGKSLGASFRVIYTTHGFHFYDGAPRSVRPYYWIERWLAHYTDAIVTINREDAEHAAQFSLKRNGQVYQIPSVGLRKDRLDNPSEIFVDWREKLHIPEDALHLISIGELNKNKNHRVVIEALHRIGAKDIFYTIVGKGQERDELKELVRDYGLEHQVNFLGYQTEVVSILKSGDIFVFPSIREGFGMAAIEAMYMGLPVIGADNRGTRECMRDGENGYVCNATCPEDFVRAINRLKEDESLRNMMGQKARQTAEGFTCDRTRAVMRQVYEDVLE